MGNHKLEGSKVGIAHREVGVDGRVGGQMQRNQIKTIASAKTRLISVWAAPVEMGLKSRSRFE